MNADHSLYAMLGDRGVHVSEVPRGLRCGCHCGACKRPLVACKGHKVPPYFRHHRLDGCPGGPGGPETALHRRAIEILSTLESIALPLYRLDIPEMKGMPPEIVALGVVAGARVVRLCEVRTEPRLTGLCPDALVRETDGTPLLLEVVVTHDVGDEKLDRIRALGYSAVAIELPRHDENLDPAQLEIKLRDDPACKRWIFHPSEVAARVRAEEAIKAAIAARAAKEFKVKAKELPRSVPNARLGPLPIAVPPGEKDLASTMAAMNKAMEVTGVRLSDEESRAFREHYWRNFARFPALGDYRVYIYWKTKAQ